ncbi:autotransporter assembly complex family protein [Methylococcus sp. EFPC2]|uniref:autotransporter assembly complex protein TamA n=1 Tax=Methylococcus sp. EFPC2 TaxID=2812648 RepID=UPI001967FEA5|nr:BamA/TamA family outer membrane protein [Methylococcus sp. EFPC2]QSA96493.1 BamA/TamA family outer membrane protein [Methylococcus sp. EFPC2]
MLWLAPPQATRAADPQPYSVKLANSGNADLDRALAESSLLLSLREQAPAGPFALVARAREDTERFGTALRSFGYYQGQVAVQIAGRSLDDPDLPDFIERVPADTPVEVSVAIDLGPLFHLRKVDIEGNWPAQVANPLDLASGAEAVASRVLAGRERLLDALRNEGYALARVESPDVVLHADERVLDVTYRVDTGQRADLGPVELKGLGHMKEAYVARRLLIQEGQRFDPAAIEQARKDLTSLGVFSSVRASVGDKLDAGQNLPIRFDFTERPLRSASVGVAYSTDLGGSLSLDWRHRNLFGEAERVELGGAVTQIGGNSTRGIGYNFAAGFTKPDFLLRDQSLLIHLGAIKQSLDAYDQDAFTGDLTLERKFSRHWSYSLGLAGEQSHITQQGDSRDYTLLGLPLTVKYDSSNSLLDPTRGLRASASITPTQPLAGINTSPFVMLQLTGSSYLDLAGDGRSVLAFRGWLGDVEGANRADLPPQKRYYAGGSATVRGYKFQSIGPLFPDEKPMGGTSAAAATVEFRQRILSDYGAVAFVDVGQVTADSPLISGTWRTGVGIGARYYTSIGPIRLDVALPLQRQSGGDAFEVYIGLGQAF